MSNLPSFPNQNYHLKHELGHNRAGGRVTYLATENATEMPVVIKQFQFAQSNSTWSDYEAYGREIQLLQQLKHPSIPYYLESFQTPNGFCIVQEYKEAPSLAQPYPWTLEEIQQIAIATLQILAYLQQQNPTVIHRDIKPENILVDRQQDRLKVYLVDFGFARTGGGEVAVSSAVKGTLGFMPPEQLFNRQLTEASDLYSLGATLICLLTNTKSSEIGKLIDDNYAINVKKILPNLEPKFIQWLEKMTQAQPKYRYLNAATALQELQSIDNIDVNNAEKPVVKNRAAKGKEIAASFGLITFGIFAGCGISLSIFAMINSVNSHNSPIAVASPTDNPALLRQTHRCRNCDLRGENLEGANLWEANLESANLKGANLTNADLTNAQLSDAKLTNANLTGANLTNAYLLIVRLTNANLNGAKLWGAKLAGANLTDAKLNYAKLGGAHLLNANLERANLAGANAMNAIFKNANLNNVNLTDADLSNADFTGAKLRSANLKGANLKGANLWGADLVGANFRGANLAGAKLGGAFIKDANFKRANLEGAIMPDGSIHN